MTMGRSVVAAAVLVLSAVGCSVAQDDLDAITELAGVVDADARCVEGDCTVQVEIEPDISVDRFVTIVESARDTEKADDVLLWFAGDGPENHTFKFAVDREFDTDRAADAFVAGRDSAGMVHLAVDLGGSSPAWVETFEVDPAEILQLAADRWEQVHDVLPGSTFSFGANDLVRIRTAGSFPQQAAAAVQQLLDGPAGADVSGVSIEQDRVRITVSSESTERVERFLADLPEADGLDIGVTASQG